MKKVIEVPYYSEFQEIDGSKEHQEVFKRRSCGIVSVKMVVDYYSKKHGFKTISLKQLIEASLRHRAYRLELGGTRKNYGWIYSGIVRTLQEFGFFAWRRHFLLMAEDIGHLRKEGASEKSLNLYAKQARKEAFESFARSIDEGAPFLVSIVKNLGRKKSPHLVVVTGYERSDSGTIKGFFINDPNNPKKNGNSRPEHKNQFLTTTDFNKIWRKTALFVRVGENE